MYKGCLITRTECRLSQLHSGGLTPLLYAISGRYCKEAAQRPFITSQAQAREWINQQIAAEEAVA